MSSIINNQEEFQRNSTNRILIKVMSIIFREPMPIYLLSKEYIICRQKFSTFYHPVQK